ncbi:MAG: family NAD(P)-dependent oxidoreductase [Subtercola sp.]|jgi:NAD(P)-dependent dehydrogenase (short-subunit alcohol dehydrogenase family)|nr:family NAD(P)-dependent oxidoreductase [Subtercola sp.]
MTATEDTGTVRFDGKVYVVTGAARGLGAAYARLLASRGASVVMNDLGASMEGSGRDLSAIRAAVDEVTAAGGIAVANGADITSADGPDSIVAAALENFGRLDGVINNAGIITTQDFAALTPEEIQQQLNVHLFGSLAVTRAAWSALTESKGSVVFTTSAGMLGSSFTIAYNIAKASVYGLVRSLATVAEPLGVRVNAVMPGAETRMQGTAVDGRSGTGDAQALLSADNAAPMAAWLVHPDCRVNGQMFTSGRGHVARVIMATGSGYSNRDMSLEGIAGNFDLVSDVSNPTIETTLEDYRTRNFSRWGE